MENKTRYIPLRTKLYLLICFIVFIALGSISYRYITKTKSLLETQMTQRSLSLSEISIKSIENYFTSWQTQGIQILKSLTKKKPSEARIFASGLIETNDDLLKIEILRHFDGKIESIIDLNSKKNRISGTFYQDWIKNIGFPNHLRSAYLVLPKEDTHYGMCLPAASDDKSLYWACLTIKKEGLMDYLSSDKKIYSFLLLKNKDFLLSQKKSFQNIEIFKKAISGNVEIGSSFFQWSDKQTYLGAYAWSEKFQFSVVYIKDIEESQKSIRIELIKIGIITLIILVISILIGYFSSGSMTMKLKQLSDMTTSIASGNFSKKISLKSNDEIGFLQNSINHMAEEIDRLLHFSVEAAKKEKELLTAKAVQETFFQRNFIQSDNLSTFGSYISADECGGDWWGYFKISERTDLVCIADATGHGAPAALVTAIAYSFFQTFTTLIKQEDKALISPSVLLNHLNEVFWEAGKGKTTMTFFIGFLDKLDGSFHYANAGHNFPFVFPKDKTDERIKKRKSGTQERFFSINQKGTPLGYEKETTYETQSIILKSGDRIFLYTDGLIECKNPYMEMWGKKNLIKTLNDVIDSDIQNITTKIIDKAYKFFESKKIDDDITIVVVEYA